MAYNSLSELFKATADAIRGKTGGTEPIVANDFPAAIKGISGGGSGSATDFFYTYEHGKEYEALDMGDVIFHKVSDTPLDTTEFDKAIAVARLTAEDGTDALFFDYKGNNLSIIDGSEDGLPGAVLATWTMGDTEIAALYSLSMDISEEYFTMPKGVWIAFIGTFNTDSYFIFHKK